MFVANLHKSVVNNAIHYNIFTKENKTMHNLNFNSMDNITLYSLAKFVVTENFQHHEEHYNLNNVEEETNTLYREEINYHNSKVFVSKDHFGDIIGSIRTIKWNYSDVLPIQKLFSINPLCFTSNKVLDIWHIGRFAIKHECDKRSFRLFKTLMVFALNEVCKSESSIAVAECDSKLLRTLKALGIEAEILADPIHYLGSETIPVLFKYDTLKEFLNKNYYLLSDTNVFEDISSIVKQSA
ncbi:hypothetical protein DD829_19725 [Chryseobacterium sp. HMWF035]|nr:hypothetical protein DBR25_17180 [Chryseobacterium sp. HMWF001]PVV52755.1 hypothetical protein DD829_19725 [Chryseobacterium sp. HMWF035]